MDFINSALDYLLGIPILGWGVHVGFVYKALLLLVAVCVGWQLAPHFSLAELCAGEQSIRRTVGEHPVGVGVPGGGGGPGTQVPFEGY